MELRYIANNGKMKNGEEATPQEYNKALDAAKDFLDKLLNTFAIYLEMVNSHAYNRNGYFEQLAKYLYWLAKAADYKYSDPAFINNKEVESSRERIVNFAKQLYINNRVGLREEEIEPDDEKERPGESRCLYCAPKGIDLRRAGPEHYTWFTRNMLKFFGSESINKFIDEDIVSADKAKFIKRLLKLEQTAKEDLRIRDLKLRYEFYSEEELLTKLSKTKRNVFLPTWNESQKKQRLLNYAKFSLCQGGLGNQIELANLLICGNDENKEGDHLTSDDYVKLMQEWDEYYLRHLRSPSTHENHREGGFYFMGLQRWNSASPAKGYSVGGGYLLYHLDGKSKKVDMGIAIDPGFDFVRNLFHMGFSLDDIDIVLISHAHLDHIRDFESIIMLLSELKKNVKVEKRVHVILSLGAYKRLEHIVEDPGFRQFLEPYIIDVDREIEVDYFEVEEKMPKFSFKPIKRNKDDKEELNYVERFRAVLPPETDPDSGIWAKITPTRAYHDDKTNYSDSFGFLIELNDDAYEKDKDCQPVKLTFGYTGDTGWVYPDMPDPLGEKRNKDTKDERIIKDIAKQYETCDVLLVHLGALVGKNKNNRFSFEQCAQCFKNGTEFGCEKLIRDHDHPYIVGMIRLLSGYFNLTPHGENTEKPLVLVSEFGEELRGTIRKDFIHRLDEVYGKRLAFLPVDVGMTVQMSKEDGEKNGSDSNCASKVWCVQCNKFVNIDYARFELYGTDHALYCVCKTCQKATPVNVLQDRLRQLYEVGLELTTQQIK